MVVMCIVVCWMLKKAFDRVHYGKLFRIILSKKNTYIDY